MRLLLLSVFGLFLLSSSIKKPAEKIFWTESEMLSWADFKGKVKANYNSTANSAVGIETSFYFDRVMIDIVVKCYFVPKESWTKTKKNIYLLKHEQKHFDVGEIYARKMRKRFQQANFSNDVEENKKTYADIVNNINKEMRAFQIEYDEATNHSIKKDVQEIWDTKIQEELESLAAYSNHEIIISPTEK